MINKTVIRVRYGETDQMGIVYYANYFTYFERGRTEFFREIGFDVRKLEEENVLLPVIETKCEYKNSARFDDEIVVCTKVGEIKGVRIRMDYEIYRKEDNELLVTGYTTHAFVNKDLKPINFRRKFKNVWDALVSNNK